MPIFCVKCVKIYTGQKKIYTGAARGARDKYEVCQDHVHVESIASEMQRFEEVEFRDSARESILNTRY